MALPSRMARAARWRSHASASGSASGKKNQAAPHKYVQDVDQIDDDGDGDASLVRLGLDALDLVVVAIDQGHPDASMVRVAPLGLGEHLGGVFDDAGGDPLVDGVGPRRRWVRRVVAGSTGA